MRPDLEARHAALLRNRDGLRRTYATLTRCSGLRVPALEALLSG